MQKMQVWSPSQEDPLEKEVATHSSILAWRIPWTEEPGVGYSPCCHKRVAYDLVIKQQQPGKRLRERKRVRLLYVFYIRLQFLEQF